MKLGICYMVFDGSELLEYAVKSIRNDVDFISITYQTTSYFGNPAEPELLSNIKKIEKLVDKVVCVENDLKKHHKVNELNLRNLGLSFSREAGCTHHISADVDEFYKPNELQYAKTVMEGDYDCSIVTNEMYYKDPTFMVTPSQNLLVTFIHPVTNEYVVEKPTPTIFKKIEPTRRFKNYAKYKVFTKEEITIHHMSYVRKDIRRKLTNSDNGQYYNKLDKFVDDFSKYQLGERVCIVPDFLNRKTKLVENTFGIQL